MNATRQAISAAARAYVKAQDAGDAKTLLTAATRLYEALGQPLGPGLMWVWLEFGTWTTTI